MATMNLDSLAQHISRQETQLKDLRRELETRQRQLAELTQRKEQLLTQLHLIDAQITAAATGKQPSATRLPRSVPTKPGRAGVVAGQAGNGAATEGTSGKAIANGRTLPAKGTPTTGAGQPSLPSLILTMIREARQPLTVPQLAEEAKRRGIRSSSAHFPKLVETRVYELKRKGLLRRAIGQSGFTLAPGKVGKGAATQAPSGTGSKTKGAPSSQRTGAAHGKQAVSAGGHPSSQARLGKPAPLREVLSKILSESTKPLTGTELAAKAIKAGYRSTSKSFVDVVWVSLGNMKNVEHVPDQGYRLKRSKTQRATSRS